MKQNGELINDYLIFRREVEKGADESTLEHIRKCLKRLDETINKPFNNATQNDIAKYQKQYAPTTQNNRLAIIKPFYRWLFKLDNKDRLPDCIYRFKSIPAKRIFKNKEITYRERVITSSEYQKLIDNAGNPRNKAILETLYFFGVRESELLSMNAEDVAFDGQFTRIKIRQSKTKAREVIHKGRLDHLMTYYESYQSYKGKTNKSLWTNQKKNRMTDAGVLYLIRSVTRKAGIDRKITPHDFRHTSISNDKAKGIPSTHIETKHGLTHGTNMWAVYDHNKTQDYENYLKARNKEVKPTYETLEKQKDKLENNLRNEVADLKTELKKKTEIDNFVMDSLSLIAREMAKTKGIEAIKELFRKNNIPLVED